MRPASSRHRGKPKNICGQKPIAATVPCGISGAPLKPKTQGPGVALRSIQRPGTSAKPDAQAALDAPAASSVATTRDATRFIDHLQRSSAYRNLESGTNDHKHQQKTTKIRGGGRALFVVCGHVSLSMVFDGIRRIFRSRYAMVFVLNAVATRRSL